MNLVQNVSESKQRPIYRIVCSRRLNALTFLALAVSDDLRDENCVDITVADYLEKTLAP